MEVLREKPVIAAFVPLAEHQSVTPASFSSGPPVLHYYGDRSKVRVLQRELGNASAFGPLFGGADAGVHTASNGDSHANGDLEEQKTAEGVDIWVTSDKLYLYSSIVSAGVSIPYRSISLHAIQTLPNPSLESSEQGVYMQLLTTTDEPSSEDLEPESFSVTIIPTASAPSAAATSELDAELTTEDTPEQTPVQALFNALSDCANLHPDPLQEDEDGDQGSRLIRSGLAFPGDDTGGLPPPMSSGGWITAENMHEFIDEDGNFIEGDNEGDDGQPDEPLGPGAGTVRVRDDGQADGNEDSGDETKWQRTS